MTNHHTPTTRTDVHRPTDLITEDYEYVGSYHNGSAGMPGDCSDWAISLRRLIHSATTTRYHSGSQCDHCGAHITYVAVLKHVPTGDHLAIGETCLDNRFELATVDFQRMRKAAQLDRERHAIRTAWDTYRADHSADWDLLDASTNTFVQDVLRKGRQYGNLSERQFESIVKAVARDAERAAIEAARPVEISTEVPYGNAVIEGIILSTKFVDGYMPGTRVEKCLVKVETETGSFKVWGTLPAKISHAERGDRVRFTASCVASDDDPSFGFFSRPRAASILEEVSA